MPTGTPFHPRLAALTASPLRYEWAATLLFPVFTSVEDELAALRAAATVTDMSPLFKFEVRGADAPRFVEHLVTKDASRLAPGGALYTPWCADDGHVRVTWSPSTGALIGFGRIAPAHAAVGSRVEVRWDRDGAHGLVPAEVVPLPFVRLRRAAA